MNRIVVVCHDLPASIGEQTARDVTAEFAVHADWYGTALCEWTGSDLILRAETDCDEDGTLTLDYFRKCIEATVAEGIPATSVRLPGHQHIRERRLLWC